MRPSFPIPPFQKAVVTTAVRRRVHRSVAVLLSHLEHQEKAFDEHRTIAEAQEQRKHTPNEVRGFLCSKLFLDAGCNTMVQYV
jgi:hypothetical protein